MELSTLSVADVIALPVAEGRSEMTYWDETIMGFGLRVRASGARSWIFQYRPKGRLKFHKLTIGNARKMKASVAHAQAKKASGLVDNNGDPQADKKKERDKERCDERFGTLVEEYLAARQEDADRGELRENTLKGYKYYLEKVFASLHPRHLAEIDRPEITACLAKMRKRSRVGELRAYTALGAFYSWAIGTRGVRSIDSSPLVKVKKPKEPEARDRVLSREEIKVIWENCKNDDFGRCVKLLLLTLCRRREVGFIEHREIDQDKSLWTIPGSRTKNHLKHLVPLPPAATAIIGDAPLREGKPGKVREPVFGQGKGGFSGWSKAKRALDERIAEARKDEDGNPVPLPRWTLHDLRRTGATTLGDELGVAPHIVEALLNHISTAASGKRGVGGTYNYAAYMIERKAALLAWADYIRTVVEGADVIAFSRRSR